MRGAALLFLLCTGLAVLVPAVSLAQSAGDEQYVDPFQEGTQQGGSGGGGGGGAGQGTGDESEGTQTGGGTEASGQAGGTVEETPPASTGAGEDPTATATEPTAGGSDVLPRTGLPVVVATLLGAGLLAAGVALRRGA
jgi:hypothetical protein